jgi:putative ABC transport system substrate-binding protein
MVGVGSDPVALRLVRTLARPAGNVTGVVALGTELWGKRLGLLQEVIPGKTRLAVLSNPRNPGNLLAVKEINTVIPATSFKLHSLAAQNAEELDRAVIEIGRQRPDALIMIWDAFLLSHAKRIADVALEHRIPTLSPIREYVNDGALLSYGANVAAQWRRAAHYVDKILKGANPGELPVERAAQFELIINLKTAKALGLTIPPSSASGGPVDRVMW